MSETGGTEQRSTPAHWPPPPPPPPPAARTHRLRWFLVGLVLVVAAGAGAFWFLAGDDGPSHPDEWAAEVLPFVEIVERERKLRFEQPVHVDFLDDDEFRAEIVAGEETLTDEDRESIEQTTSLLRALGLVEGDLDLFDASSTLLGAGVVGLYSFEDERILMRGTELTPSSKVALVHELTHALQDQHFRIGTRFEELTDAEDITALTVYQAIIEGDAERVATSYRWSLSEEEQVELDEAETEQFDHYESDREGVPLVLETFQVAPYALGEALLALVEELDGTEAIDDLFIDPPDSEEHLVDPWTLFADDAPADVTVPELDQGDTEFDSGTFGALGWLVVLGERIPLIQALDAIDGWGGDAYVAFDRDGVSCVRIRFTGDTADDTEQMRAALRDWVAGLEGGPATVQQIGSELLFESCDPGAAAGAVGRNVSDEALGMALTRTYLALDAVSSGASEEEARCFGDALVREFSLEELNDPDGFQDPASQERLTDLVSGCQ